MMLREMLWNFHFPLARGPSKLRIVHVQHIFYTAQEAYPT